MAISTVFDFTKVQEKLNQKIKEKKEEIDFFVEKIIVEDASKEENISVIYDIDKESMSIIDAANNKLENVKKAYQNRIDGGARTDLFWRIVGVTSAKYSDVTVKGQSAGSYLSEYGTTTYVCTRLNEQGYGNLNGVTTKPPVPTSQGYPITKTSTYTAKGQSTTKKYTYFLNQEEFDEQYPEGSSQRDAYFANYPYGINMFLSPQESQPPPGENVLSRVEEKTKTSSIFNSLSEPSFSKYGGYYAHNTLIGFESDKLHGIKYYDEPRTRDLADTTVTTFTGYISTGSSELTVLSASNSGVLDSVKPGQLIITNESDDNIFPVEYSKIVSIGTTVGNLDYLNPLTPATAFAIANAGTIATSVQITNEGFGYNFTPTVTAQLQGGIQAKASAIVSAAGTISEITITEQGDGYVGIPSVIASVQHSQAFADANVSAAGTISNVVVSVSGLGYTSSPSVSISSFGINATGIATVSLSGTISAIDIVQIGFGYTANDISKPISIAISGPPGVGTTAIALPLIDSAGFFTSITITDGGSGYDLANPPSVNISNPNYGKKAKLKSSIDATGKVTSVDIIDGGLNYSNLNSPVVSISTHTGITSAILTASVTGGGKIHSINIVNGGVGYTSSNLPKIIIDPPIVDPLNTATFSASVNSGVVTSITILNSGYGYPPSSIIPLDIELPYSDVLGKITLETPPNVSVASTSPITFRVLISANTLTGLVTDYSLPFGTSPFSPQTIGIMKSSKLGIGTYLVYDNSGEKSDIQSWKPELKAPAFGDPNTEFYVPEVKEPSVGAGLIWYKPGFKYAPYKPKSGVELPSFGFSLLFLGPQKIDENDFEPAQEGDTITVPSYVNKDYLLQRLPDKPDLENALQVAIQEAKKSEEEMKNSTGLLSQLLTASNTVREVREDTNTEIWGYRLLVGTLQEEISELNEKSNKLKS